MPTLAQPDVVVHLPSGPVAGALVGDRHVDVAGVLLPRLPGERSGEVLAKLPATRGAVYAAVTPYIPGALERVGGLQAPQHHEHGGEGHQGQQQGHKRAGHGAKVGRRAARQQSGGRR